MMEELGPGSFVTPTVRLVSPLAQGGMGTVWIAEHLVLETKVVVKLMTKELASNVDGAARFAREAAIAAAVKSPHVVQVFDSGVTEDGVAYIVMELLEGHDLGAQLTANGRLAPAEVAIIVTQLSKALAKSHRVQVIHRDLKPENVFLCDVEGGEAFVKLLDFGTAKDEARAPFTTTAGQLLGTPYYMSPEQILGEEVDTRADVWSLGVLAFEATTGVRPFEGVTVGAITLAIHTTQPRMTDIVPELPPALDEWFARACALRPAERFQTVRAAGDAFARAATGDAFIVDSSPELIVESSPGSPAFPIPLVTGRHRPAFTPSERVATSLSSTLSSPRHERRRLQWIAAFVVIASVIGMLAFFVYEPAVTTPTSTPAWSAPAVAATAPPPAPSPSPSAASPSPAPSPSPSPSAASPSPSPSTPPPSSSATASSSPSSATRPTATPLATSTPATTATTLPFPHETASATAARTAPPPPRASSAPPASAPALPRALPSASALAPALPSPSALPSAPAPVPSPDPTPTTPIDLHDLLPPASPPP
jgi:serine/threonine protein kinase